MHVIFFFLSHRFKTIHQDKAGFLLQRCSGQITAQVVELFTAPLVGCRIVFPEILRMSLRQRAGQYPAAGIIRLIGRALLGCIGQA
ncbi:hypothetical protein N805_29025 [Pseudomonas putida S13.1.2]|uniref:Uncharacterized protein n=1 Tax=Pseudomonas putida S13.1.2 TaxID=1384061 RepID=A0AAU8SCY2_PSEPU|nr:hypothetical protein N805_29025 [Pseudomonas putida S13.1.2]